MDGIFSLWKMKPDDRPIIYHIHPGFDLVDHCLRPSRHKFKKLIVTRFFWLLFLLLLLLLLLLFLSFFISFSFFFLFSSLFFSFFFLLCCRWWIFTLDWFFSLLISLLRSFSSRPTQAAVVLDGLILRKGSCKASTISKTDHQKLLASWKLTPLFKNGIISPPMCPLTYNKNILLTFLSRINELYTTHSKTKTTSVSSKPRGWAQQQCLTWKYRNADDIIKS